MTADQAFSTLIEAPGNGPALAADAIPASEIQVGTHSVPQLLSVRARLAG